MLTVAQVEPAPPAAAPSARQREAVRQGATLTVAALLAILMIGAFALVLLARYRRAILERQGRSKSKGAARTDAWHESARRLNASEPGGADDDTVDIDPEDLSPDDVDDGDGPGGKGWKP